MSESKTYKAMADAFAAEGVRAHFTLMGDGNMHWVTSLAGEHGVRTIHARHENCALAMAMGYARAANTVGVASVTMGPGFTQTATSLTSAVRNNVPLVVLAGDGPTTNRWHHQRFEQAPLALSTGARFVGVRSVERALDSIQEAFVIARSEQCPVVLSVPLDIQHKEMAQEQRYVPSTSILPKWGTIVPSETVLAELATMIAAAEQPIFIGGRGAIADAAEAIEELAECCGALLATTLPARGLFDNDPYTIGIAGGFSTDLARDCFAKADLVVSFGASLGQYTADGGRLYPQAKVVQVDVKPRGLHHGLRVADHHVTGDARLTAEGLTARLRTSPRKAGMRPPALAAEIAAYRDPAYFDIEPGVVDPRSAIQALNKVLPNDWGIVGASGHSFYFSVSNLKGRSPAHFVSLKDFGEIGSHLSIAIGVAVARDDGKVAVIDGDGSLIMHIQELETIQRHGLRLLIVALNDGAYGAELHKLRKQDHFHEHAVFGRPDFAAIATAFGLRGATITDNAQFAELFERHAAANRAEMWNVHISQNVISPPYRRRHGITTKTAKEIAPAR